MTSHNEKSPSRREGDSLNIAMEKINSTWLKRVLSGDTCRIDLHLVLGVLCVMRPYSSGCARRHCASSSKAHPQCEEEGLKCNPSSSDVLIAAEEMVEGLGGWRACLTTRSGNITHTTITEQVPRDMLCPDASNHSELLCPDAPNPSELW